jgi:hypothetical protein
MPACLDALVTGAALITNWGLEIRDGEAPSFKCLTTWDFATRQAGAGILTTRFLPVNLTETKLFQGESTLKKPRELVLIASYTNIPDKSDVPVPMTCHGPLRFVAYRIV